MASVHLVSQNIQYTIHKNSRIMIICSSFKFQTKFSFLKKPWFLDGKLTSSFRESPHIDGSFLAKPSDFLPQDQESEILFIDWKKDPIMNSKGGFDIVEALSPDGIYGLLDQGKVHAKVMESRGCFQNLKKKDRFD